MEPEKKSNGATVGLIVILTILILGGIYVWRAKLKSASENQTPANSTVSSDDSASLDQLDKDVNNTGVDAGTDVNSVN